MHIVSPYISAYEFKKMQDPTFQYGVRQVPYKDYLFVQRIEEMTKGATVIESAHDWQAVFEVFEFLYQRFPNELTEFKKQIEGLRKTRSQKGYSKNKETMYVAALPNRFERMLRRCFPHQQFDKKFVWKLARRIPIFKITGESN